LHAAIPIERRRRLLPVTRLVAVAFLIGAVYLSRIGTRLQRLAVGDEPTGANEGSTLLDRCLLGYGMNLVVLLIAVWTWCSSRGSDAAGGGGGG
jgi:hypothetical protein